MRARAIGPMGFAAAPAVTGLWALVAWEARRARRRERPFTEALPGSGLVGEKLGGTPLRVAWLGDSLAAGLGCEALEDTPAHLTARLLERPVDVSMLAVPGARTHEVLRDQLPQLDAAIELVVLCVGANDVASGISRARYAAQLDEIIATVAPTPVVLLSLPDMAMPDRMAQPLRTVAGLASRYYDSARAKVAATHPHVVCVDIASRPEGLSRKAGRALLCADRFHPGPQGYRLWAERIAQACHGLLEPSVAPALID